jgi:hypothetical protein
MKSVKWKKTKQKVKLNTPFDLGITHKTTARSLLKAEKKHAP